MLDRGKTVFAETCARCHSSKLPDEARAKMRPAAARGRTIWHAGNAIGLTPRPTNSRPRCARSSRALISSMDNYLSTRSAHSGDVAAHQRLQPARQPMPSAATSGIIFLRRNLQGPSLGRQDDSTGSVHRQTLAIPDARRRARVHPRAFVGGGWSSAPFLLNNRLGPFSDDPSVDARMKVFDASIEQLLWPEKRDHEQGV